MLYHNENNLRFILPVINWYKTLVLVNYKFMENKLWYYRNQRNMSLKELSRKTGISVTGLNKIENEKTNDILLSNAIIISKVLKVDLYELFCIKQ